MRSARCHTMSVPLSLQGQLEAHQEEGMVVSHMAIAGVGIWVAFTSGSTLRRNILYYLFNPKGYFTINPLHIT